MAKWYPIGVQLGVDQAKLKEIEVNYRAADRCFVEVVSFWLGGNTPVAVSWESLVEVLEQSFVGEKGLAMRLREKGGMLISDTVRVSGATESEVQSQGGKKRSATKLDDNGDQPPKCQGTQYTMFVQ
jgi:hypothetical protein